MVGLAVSQKLKAANNTTTISYAEQTPAVTQRCQAFTLAMLHTQPHIATVNGAVATEQWKAPRCHGTLGAGVGILHWKPTGPARRQPLTSTAA